MSKTAFEEVRKAEAKRHRELTSSLYDEREKASNAYQNSNMRLKQAERERAEFLFGLFGIKLGDRVIAHKDGSKSKSDLVIFKDISFNQYGNMTFHYRIIKKDGSEGKHAREMYGYRSIRAEAPGSLVAPLTNVLDRLEERAVQEGLL